jgi:hypothetical protein
MLILLKDAEGRHDVFISFGAIALDQLESWMRSSSLIIPRDLVEFWSHTGGGDLFDDAETMLRPTRVPSNCPGFVDGDDVDSATQFRIRNGMPDSYLLFHLGTGVSAIRLPDQMFVTLNNTFEETAVFPTFEDWYSRTRRAAYGQQYGLGNEGRES